MRVPAGSFVATMASTDFVQSFEARLALYSLDDRARVLVKEAWPLIEPTLDRAIDEILIAVRALPHVGDIVTRNRDLLKKLEVAHFSALLGGNLDEAYAESCRRTVEQEAALGFDARMRSTAGNYVLKAALDALARKYRFSPAKAADRGKAISQVIAFDVANAMTLHRQAAERASVGAARRHRRRDRGFCRRHRRGGRGDQGGLGFADGDLLDA